jgi:deoxyribonuclease IV
VTPRPPRPLLPPPGEIAGRTPRLGAHVSAAGGMPRAIERATELGCTAIQIFVKNQQQWTGREVPAAEAAAFRAARAASPVKHVLAHASYLVNLASPEDGARARSIAALHDEMRRCAALGVDALVLHPGAHRGSGEAAGLERVAAALRELLDRPDVATVALLVECTAGQGSSVGYRLEHLAAILSGAGDPTRLGVCLDTCHLFAAGYDLRSAAGHAALCDALEKLIGVSRVRAFHLNDSRAGLGARVDRHAPIGAGHIGRAPFARLLQDARFAGVPMVLETPGGMAGWRRELQSLRRLLRPVP